jgi:hypothetical protein
MIATGHFSSSKAILISLRFDVRPVTATGIGESAA